MAAERDPRGTGASGDPVRHELFVQIQMTLAGHPVPSALAATVDSLITGVGIAADDLGHGERLIDAYAEDAKRHLRDNWAYLRQERANMLATGGKAGRA